jgi:hypothetical protein
MTNLSGIAFVTCGLAAAVGMYGFGSRLVAFLSGATAMLAMIHLTLFIHGKFAEQDDIPEWARKWME